MRARCGPTSTSQLRSAACFVVACALLLGCSIDDRTLTDDDSVAGSSNASGGTASGGAPSAAGSSGSAPLAVEIPVCVYEGEVSAECATLVKNAGFSDDTVPWKPEAGLLGAWAKADAGESDASGSIRVVNLLHGEADGFAPGAAEQCVAAEAGRIYDLAGDVFITEGQGAGLEGGPYIGRAGLSIFFFESDDCNDSGGENSIGNADTPRTEAVGVWTHGATSAVAPEQARSFSVRLNTLMPFRQYKFEALFDNVLVRER